MCLAILLHLMHTAIANDPSLGGDDAQKMCRLLQKPIAQRFWKIELLNLQLLLLLFVYMHALAKHILRRFTYRSG